MKGRMSRFEMSRFVWIVIACNWGCNIYILFFYMFVAVLFTFALQCFLLYLDSNVIYFVFQLYHYLYSYWQYRFTCISVEITNFSHCI